MTSLATKRNDRTVPGDEFRDLISKIQAMAQHNGPPQDPDPAPPEVRAVITSYGGLLSALRDRMDGR